MKRTLASIVLGFEVIVVFLAALVMFGLGALPPVVALVGGVVMCLLLLATVALLRFPAAYLAGWILQGVLVLSGFFNPAMFFIGAMFAGMWIYCMVTGDRIDRQQSRQEKESI
ncbi:MAG: hypothetical protein JWQ68_1614 [Cryobacterium sp.]|nr:hypothetical protein [Cryobacterium sp.]